MAGYINKARRRSYEDAEFFSPVARAPRRFTPGAKKHRIRRMPFRRLAIALLLGLMGAVIVWFVAPYNNFILGNAFVSDDFLPVAAVGLMLVPVLIVNPLLHRFAPRMKLSAAQLGLIFGILLVACITPGQGGLRHILHPIGATPANVSRDATLAEAYRALDPPPSLFPETLGFDEDVPASEWFLDELPPGERIPWGKWRGPLLAWGALFAPYWLMLVALGVIVLPYWRDVERQPFPLLEVQRCLIEDSAGRALPPVLTTKLFWIGFGLVFVLHLMSGGHAYFPDRIPEIPQSFDLTPAFTEHPVRYLPSYLMQNRIHFLFLGIAFFMPTRVSFSIWFMQFAYGITIMVRQAYLPPYSPQMLVDQRIGAWIAVPCGILWLGRRHFLATARSLFHRPRNDGELRSRVAAGAFLLGWTGVLAWLLWVGVPPLWAFGLAMLMFLFALGLTRIVAETGIPLMAPDTGYIRTLAGLIPVGWRTAAGMYFSGIVAIIAGHLNRVCATTVVCHALGLDAKVPPRRHLRLAGLFFGVIVLSVVVGGAIQLGLSYTHASSLDGRSAPIGVGGAHYFRWYAEPLLRDFMTGHVQRETFSEWRHIFFGGGLAALLQFLCQLSARWPLHPVALLFVGNWYAHRIGFSVLLGWLLKTLIVHYGGARTFRSSKALFLGLILGEVVAVVFWALVTAIVALRGHNYKVVEILPF